MALPKFSTTDDKPKSLRESIYTYTPVILTVVATVLAGMSSGEMTRAQYYRSFAAQLQAKAADQWGYYQAKRSRATEAQNTLEVISVSAQPGRLDRATLLGASEFLLNEIHAIPNDRAEEVKAETDQLQRLDQGLKTYLNDPSSAPAFMPIDQQIPSTTDKPIADQDILTALDQISQGQTETQMATLLRKIPAESFVAAFGVADQNLAAFDKAAKPAGDALDKLHASIDVEAGLARGPGRAPGAAVNAEPGIEGALADIAAARLRYSAARYEREAQYNGAIGNLLEVQVRQNSVISDRNRNRSSELFYGMLAAQAGVTISTLALAVRRKNVFWSLAAVAGATAIGFSGYIYLFT